MIDENFIELMNKEIDKVITENEKVELHNYLSNNKHAKDYYNELLSTVNYLDGLPDAEPPAYLEKHIINSININKYLPREKRKNIFDFLFVPKFKLAYTFAAGLIAGIIIFFVLSNRLNNSNLNKEISGTIGISNNEMNTIQEIPLNFSGISGKIQLKESGNNFFADINSNSLQKFDVIISYPESMKFENISPGSGNKIEFSNEKNSVKISGSGLQKYTLSFTQNNLNSSAIEILVSQSGKNIFKQKVSLNK